MRSRWRTEAAMALVYTVAVPAAVFAAAVVQITILDVTSSPTLSYTHKLLLRSVPAFATGAVFFVIVRVGAQREGADVHRARWLVRAAPLILSAAVPTALGAWLVLVEGHSRLNGLVVLPALILWGGIAGEWFAHHVLAKGRPSDMLLRHVVMGAGAVVGLLVLSALILRSPEGERNIARNECRKQYARSQTAEDSAFARRWKPTVARELGTRSCSELLARDPAAPPDSSLR